MPYIGLLDKADCEIVGAAGYHRVDMVELSFRLSPARDPSRWHCTIVLDREIEWLAQNDWPWVWAIAVFDEIDSREPVNSSLLDRGPLRPARGDKLRIGRGALTLDVEFTGNRAREPAGVEEMG